jgi:hypothetical protein
VTRIGTIGSGAFVQGGGTFTTGPIIVGGAYPGDGSYTFTGGLINCTSLSVNRSDFWHSGGTNSVNSQIFIGEGNYYLSGGQVDTDFISLGADRDGPGWFVQTGGKHFVTNTLDLFGQSMSGDGPAYFLEGGALDCGQIDIDFNGTVQHTGGSLDVHGPVTLANGGSLMASNVTENLGPLILGGGAPCHDAVLNATQHFANSANVPWATDTYIAISAIGGAIYFGNSSSALTARQLLHIWFNGGNNGPYARLNDDGQLIGWPVPPIDIQVTSTNLMLNWTAAWESSPSPYRVLQSAENVQGPYIDVTNATSPYPVPFDGPTKFFRMRTN